MTDFIEDRIRPLVEALNSWPGIETFSSCEGHKMPGSQSVPHVTFTCQDESSLREVCARLRGTRWAITLEDFSYGPELHFTLRHMGRSLDERISLQEIQAAIPSIADLLRSDTRFEPHRIKNNFPRLECSRCRGDTFAIQADMRLGLAYADNIYPTLVIRDIASAGIICEQCGMQIETGREAASEIWSIMDHTNNNGSLFTQPLKDASKCS